MIKKLSIIFILAFFPVRSFTQNKVENIIIITADGLRWQEIFSGMDSAIARNRKFNQNDSANLFRSYWHNDAVERRKKLMPFMWSTIMNNGQIYGNRTYNCKVNTTNPYKFSYPGYSEIFTGYADTLINSNEHPGNPHVTLLEFINRVKRYNGKVAAFTAWDAFDRILNEKRGGFPVIAAFDTTPSVSASQMLLNEMLRNSYKPWGDHECLDVFTHYGAMEYMKSKQPKVLYIGYGETDEWAHAALYRDYLNSIRQLDKWLKDIWTYIQSDPAYKNKTALFITTDHGRGDKNKDQWTSHGKSIDEAGEIWFAVMAPNVSAKGEVKESIQLYQKQFSQTIASLLGLTFVADHPIGEKIKL
jgi:hypothetical protein